MRIIRATHLGMCFGVRDAIDLALQHAGEEPVTIVGELVHNRTVNEALAANGIRISRRLEDVHTPTAMVTAHGASEKALARMKEKGLKVVQATCPLVHYAHRSLTKLVNQGYYPVIIGIEDHVEVRGMTEDLDECTVVLDDASLERIPARDRLGIVCQTTQPLSRVNHLVGLIRERFPEADVRFADTVCRPTKERQAAAVELARQSDVVIVVGGANSNNTRELAATCSRYCEWVYKIQNPHELQPEWLQGASTVGLTAGTSTPDELIDAVENHLRTLAADRQRTARAEPQRAGGLQR